MNPIIINMDEMSDSTEVYSTRPSPVFAILIYFLTGALVLGLIWMALSRIDIVTHADGMIRSSSTTATITNITAGTVASWEAGDGEYVREGQVIFSLDPTELKIQETSCISQLEDVEERLEILDAYYRELGGEPGALNSCASNRHYEEYKTKLEAVKINRDIVYADTGTQRSQFQNNLSSINNSISSLTAQQSKLNQMIADISARTNSFAPGEVYYHTAVESYISKYNYTANQYDIQIAELEKAQGTAGFPGEGGNTGIQAPADNTGAIRELKNQKALALNQLETETLAFLEQSISSVQSNLSSLGTSRSEAENNLAGLNNGSLELSTDQIIINEKNAVNTEINTYESQKKEYEDTLNTLQARIKECDVKAQSDGYLNLSVEKTKGDHVSAGEQIGSIVPDGEGVFKTVIYVENQDIGSVRKGQKIRYDVAPYSQTEGYGIFEGEVTSVSKDIKVNKDTGTGCYEVEATITVRGSAKGEKPAEFIQGMAVRAKLVTGEKSVLGYLLEKINLVDE